VFESPSEARRRLNKGEEDHLASRNPWWLDWLEGVGDDPLFLHRNLEHPAKGPIVAMDRTRRVPRLDLVVQPVLDFVGGEPSDLVRTETGEDVLVDVASVGLLVKGERRRASDRNSSAHSATDFGPTVRPKQGFLRGFGGHRRPVMDKSNMAPDLPLQCDNCWRRRPESNWGGGLCSTVPIA